MITNDSLPWTYDLDQATRLQENLSRRLLLSWDGRPVHTVAGIDVSDTPSIIYSAIAIYGFPELKRLSTVTADAPPGFPYIPGMLAFRIGPAILAAWERLKQTPDLVILHGQGTAHPRRLGLASHIGLWLGLPTIGVARTRLYGIYDEVGSQAGDWSELRDESRSKQVIGAALRTQASARPVYVSPGHMIDLAHAIEFVLASCRAYRMPEPVRAAAQAAARSRQEPARLVTSA